MKHPQLTLALISLTMGLAAARLQADSQVFQIGLFDGQNGDFEQESDAYNTPGYYTEPGDYSATQGNYGFGEDYPGPGAEILQDGPNGTVDPGDPGSAHNWSLSPNGFPRALAPGRPVLDVFFQLSATEAASGALLLETDLFGLGANSFHDLIFYINNVPFHRQLNVRGTTPLKLTIPRNQPGVLFNTGANVLSVRRSGGGLVDAAGPNNPWIQFDALRLTAEVAAPQELIWQIGSPDNGTAEFEQESGAFNNPQYYLAAGDYSTVRGQAGLGGSHAGPDAEIWQDAGGDSAASLEGFPRALVPGRPAVDIYFQLTAQQAQQNHLSFRTILFALGANGSHDVRAYLNGTPIAVGLGITGPLQVETLIPRRGVLAAGMGPEFLTGKNVLSLVRTGGGPVDPLGVDNPWIQFDFLSLATAAAPQTGQRVEAYQTVFSVGNYDSAAGEFEQESGAFNNPSFYADAGDYSLREGKAGFGVNWAGPEPEIWQDGPSGTWADSNDGFPRALIKQDWGRPIIDVFFQADAGALDGPYLFTTKLFGLGPDSSHDLEFYINGIPFYTQAAVNKETYVTALLPAGSVEAGGNVISQVRTGGLNTDTAWIQFDQVELITRSTTTAPLPAFSITELTRSGAGAVTLTWESEDGARYDLKASSALESGWATIAPDIAGTAGTTTYTDSAVPANTTRRFYKVARTR
ncbi:MAG: hypothetical protein V4675_04215 [Verrucomicrobiota bacterium]